MSERIKVNIGFGEFMEKEARRLPFSDEQLIRMGADHLIDEAMKPKAKPLLIVTKEKEFSISLESIDAYFSPPKPPESNAVVDAPAAAAPVEAPPLPGEAKPVV